jgi:rhodanese-related sulfurtransferase
MLTTLLRMLIVIAVGIASALAANALRWDRNSNGMHNSMPLITPPRETPKAGDLVTLKEARQLWEMQGVAFFLDARPPRQYSQGHIAMAWNLPADQFQQYLPNVQPMLAPDSPIVVYCDGIECELSHRVAKKLRDQGYQNVRVLVNGLTLWKEAGLAINEGDQP